MKKLIKKLFIPIILINLICIFDASALQKKSKEKKLREKIVLNAREYIGLKYRYGGISSRGFDCSGFVRHIYKLNGINLPRKSIDQYHKGKKISLKKVQLGDLVFFKIDYVKLTHVGIYIGEGKFIHSPSSGKKIRISTIENSYWKKRLFGAVNYIN